MDTGIVTAAEDADMAEYDGEKVVTMMDVLQEQEDFENDANAVLGASDEKNCTYTKGYIKRQAIYACMTCCAEAKDDPTKRAGVCLACSLSCHENHELIELYTKRNFRCDCGNPKFNSNPCQYTSAKPDLNENNEYNQNFSGLYCVCKRPYPDPENSIEDEMIQCIICEDWLHASHLEATLPPNDQYSEMICKNCMEKNSFLHDYSNFAVNVENNDIDVLGDDTVNTILNCDTNNETTKNTDAIQKSSDKQEEGKLAEPKNSDPASVKDGDDIDAMPIDSNKSTKEEQECNSETAENVIESDSKTNNIDAESIEEDMLLADPEEDGIEEKSKPKENVVEAEEDGIEEKSKPKENVVEAEEDGIEEKSKQKENVVEDNQKNKNTPDKEDGGVVSEDNKNAVDTETNESNEIGRDDNSVTLKVNLPDSLNKENVTITEHDETSKKADEKQHPEIDNEDLMENTTDQNNTNCKQNAETDVTETNENTILNVSTHNTVQTELQGNLEEINVSEKSTNNVEDGSDSKTDVENKKEVSNEAQTGIACSTNNNESNDSKTDISENSENTVSQNTKDFCETNNKANEDNIENTDVEMKNEDDLKNINGSEDKTTENKRKLSTEESASKVESSGINGKRIKLDSNCIRPKNVKRMYKGATFWPSDFRQKLCTCNECLTMYKDLSVLFLTDFEDTVKAYENLGEEKERIEGKPASQYEKGLQALSSLDRIQQVNALTEYNKMRDKLLEFLKSFKDRKEVVKEEDIKEFFAGMKPKREPDGVYFCR